MEVFSFVLVVAVIAGMAKLTSLQVRHDWRGNWKRCFQCKSCDHVDYYAWVTPNPCEACGEVGTQKAITARAKFWGGYEIKGQP